MKRIALWNRNWYFSVYGQIHAPHKKHFILSNSHLWRLSIKFALWENLYILVPYSAQKCVLFSIWSFFFHFYDFLFIWKENLKWIGYVHLMKVIDIALWCEIWKIQPEINRIYGKFITQTLDLRTTKNYLDQWQQSNTLLKIFEANEQTYQIKCSILMRLNAKNSRDEAYPQRLSNYLYSRALCVCVPRTE